MLFTFELTSEKTYLLEEIGHVDAKNFKDAYNEIAKYIDLNYEHAVRISKIQEVILENKIN